MPSTLPSAPEPVRPKHIYSLHFDIVHGCQLRCVGCPNSTLKPKIWRISVDDFRTCLGNIDVERVHTMRLFNFGEPLLHKELSQIISVIAEQPWKVSILEISTNAQRVEWVDFEEAVKQEVVNRLVVSCDGDGTPAEYERLRPPSKWSQLIEFLERARALRDRWSPALQLITKTVVRNADDMRRWREVLEPRGWTPEFRGWMALPESETNMTNRELKVPSGACVFLAEPDEYTEHPWHGEIRLLYVDADGTVVPCCIHPKAGDFGNLKHHKYSEIVNGRLRAEFKQQMTNDRAGMRICSQCDMGPVGNEGPSFHSAMFADI
ncbi:MAG: SPASM domain-containing protein [Rhodanobacteraceae bacterium]